MARESRWPWIAGAFLVVVIFIVGFVNLGLIAEGEHDIDRIERALLACHDVESLHCSDYNPCTMDLIQPLCGQEDRDHDGRPRNDHRRHCRSHTCSHKPLADGSCCNQYDSCYLPDDDKKCFNGQCISPDPTKCKGYCTQDSDCSPTLVPLIDGFYYTDTFCLLGSCATLIGVDVPQRDPNNFLNLTTQANLNISSCLQARCAFGPFLEVYDWTACIYTFNCASFAFNMIAKRSEQAGVNGSNGQPNLFNFTFPGITNSHQYGLLNNAVNDRFRNFFPTPSPTV